MMNIEIAPSNLPLRWKGTDHKVVRAGIAGNEPYAEVIPKNDGLEDALKTHLREHHGIKVIWRNGFCELIDPA